MGNVQFIRGTPRRSTLAGVVQALQSGIQGYQGAQDRRMAQDKNSLADALTRAKINELEANTVAIDPKEDLIADPGGSGLIYSKSQRQWINPKSGQFNLNQLMPADSSEDEQNYPEGTVGVDDDGDFVDAQGNKLGRADQ